MRDYMTVQSQSLYRSRSVYALAFFINPLNNPKEI